MNYASLMKRNKEKQQVLKYGGRTCNGKTTKLI